MHFHSLIVVAFLLYFFFLIIHVIVVLFIELVRNNTIPRFYSIFSIFDEREMVVDLVTLSFALDKNNTIEDGTDR